jgi:anaerobic dimethyl sulfoxide reductase subunit B (iron-sulfur subunit)
VDAITKSDTDGRVLVDEALCIGCRACADACPFGVPQFGEDDIMQKCDLCFDQPLSGTDPPCVDTCPGKALTLTLASPTEKKVQEDSIHFKYVSLLFLGSHPYKTPMTK